MIRTLALAAAFALTASLASAAGTAPYKLDAGGKCRDAKGAFAKAEMYAKTPTAAARCKNDKGQFAKCGSPGAKPVK